MVLQVLNARFRPYILAEADTLDTVTQAVSMVSILLAQYVHATSHYSEGMSNAGKKIATVLFLVSNVVLTLVHLRIISAPLFAKLRIAFSAAVACARGTESAEPGGAERDEDVIYNDAVTEQDDAEGDGDVIFDGAATGVSPRFDSSLWATRISECVMQDIEVEMNPVGDSSDRNGMQTVLQQWRAFASKPSNAESKKQTKPFQEPIKAQLSELHQSDRWAIQTVLQQWRAFASNPNDSSPESKKQTKHSRKRTKKARSNELHSSAATDTELSVIVHI